MSFMDWGKDLATRMVRRAGKALWAGANALVAPEKYLIKQMARSPAKALLATVLGLSAAWIMPRIPIPGTQSLHNRLYRDLGRMQLQHTYQIRHWSQVAAMPGAVMKAIFSKKHSPAPILTVQPPARKIGICDPRKPYPEDPKAWCIITADALEEHNNPNFRPGMAGQHRALTWPGEGDPIGPDPTRIQQWRNIDHVRAFHQALHGQLTPEQIKQAANDALHDVNPKLNTGTVDKVAPAIITPHRGVGQDMPFDSGTSHPPEEPYTITPDYPKLPLAKPSPQVQPQATPHR